MGHCFSCIQKCNHPIVDSASSGSSDEFSGKRKRKQSRLKKTTGKHPRANKKVTRSLSDLQERLVSILKCPVCMEMMQSPILQCSSGHNICSACIKRVSHCPVCRISVSNPVRNIGLEKISEEVDIPCPNNKHGCQDKVLGKMDPHYNCCPLREYNCPIWLDIGTHCFWKGPHSRLLEHAMESHPQDIINGNNSTCMFEFKSEFGIHVKLWQCKENLFIFYNQYIKWQQKVWIAVQYVGPSDIASKFAYEITLASPNETTKIVYTRKVHTMDDDIQTLFKTDNCFTSTEQQMKLFEAPNEEFNLQNICIIMN